MANRPLPLDPATRNRSLYGGFFGLALFEAVGLFVIGHSFVVLVWAIEAQGYVERQAYVENVRNYSVTSKRSTTTYYEITYGYSFGDRLYQGDRSTIARDDITNSILVGQALEAWKTHQTIPVWVNPSNPRRSVLDRTIVASDFLPSSCLGFLFASVGYWFLYLQTAELRSTQPNAYRALPMRRNLKWRAVYVLFGLAVIAPVLAYVLFVMGSTAAIFPLIPIGVCLGVLLGLRRRKHFYKKLGNIEARLTKSATDKGVIFLDFRLEQPKVLDALELRLTCRLQGLKKWETYRLPEPTTRYFTSKDFQPLDAPNTYRTTFEYSFDPPGADLITRLEVESRLAWELEVKALEIGQYVQKIDLDFGSFE